MVTGRRDELPAVPDVIGTDGDEDFSAFATSRWPGLVRLAFGLTGMVGSVVRPRGRKARA